MNEIPVSKVMTREVLAATPGMTLFEVGRLLRRGKISGVPVVDAGQRVLGVVSEKDIVKALDQAHALSEPGGLLDLIFDIGITGESRLKVIKELLSTVKAEEAMSRDTLTVRPGASIDSAARLMKENRVNRLPVVENGKLVGIVTRHDVISTF
jgi:CBS domain-containing protein